MGRGVELWILVTMGGGVELRILVAMGGGVELRILVAMGWWVKSRGGCKSDQKKVRFCCDGGVCCHTFYRIRFEF